jgi:hypothetical protein
MLSVKPQTSESYVVWQAEHLRVPVAGILSNYSVSPSCSTLYPESYKWSALFLKTNHDDDDFKSPDSVSIHKQHFLTLMYCRHSVFGAPLSATASFGVLLKT